MSGKHMCQLRDEEKANLLCELRDAVARLDALQPRPQPKYAPEELPNFLKERIPRFKKNLDLQPLITHTAVGDIRFTSDVEKVNAQSDDPNVKYALVPGAGNPFAPAYSLSDSLCEDFCNQAMAAEKMRTGRKSKPAFVPKPFCMTQEPNDAPRDPSGHIYDCEHNKMYEGISICNPHGHSQSYLCTEHVYPRK